MYKRITALMVLAVILLTACSKKYGRDIQISNDLLTVVYDSKNKSLEAIVKSTNKVILKKILPADVTESFKKKKVVDSRFGTGICMVIDTGKGGSIAFTLYPSQPFIFITPTIKNDSNDVVNIDKLKPLSFLVDLGKPAALLKTLGTGGLHAPDKNPGSYVFLTTVDPKSRNGVVAGWLSHEKGSGVLFSGVENGLVKINAQIDYGQYRLSGGCSETIETLVIGYFDDARLGEELFADVLARYNRIKLRERSSVYCTWYSEKHGGAGSEASSLELAKYIKDNLKPFGLGVIQIDDQWQDGGSYNGPTRGFDRARKIATKGAVINGTATNGFPAGYPNGMEKTAKGIKEAGLTAGIWWMPFARNHKAPEYINRQHWFAYRTNGLPFETAWGGTSLDLTHPEVLEHIGFLSKRMHSWGFDYFKMDGLWTGSVTEQVYINDGYKNDSIGNCRPLYNPSITQIEAYRNGLKAIRRATNGEVFLSGCCISQNMRSFGASIGLVDAMRIGPDFNHDGESIRTGAIRASRLYFLNGRVWWNDPDPSMLRESGRSVADPAANGIGSLTRARLLPSFVAISSQFFLSSDWIPDLPEDRIEILRRCMASHQGTVRPVDAFNKSLPSIWVAKDDQSGTPRTIVGLFNWETKLNTLGCSLDWAGISDDNSYYAFDFWKNRPIDDISDSISLKLASESCRIIALRAKSNHPVVVSTSQHVTQGMIDLLKEEWKNETLSGTSKVIGYDNYELRIAGLNEGGQWILDKAAIVGNMGNATIEVLPQTEEGWLRIVIKSSKNQEVKWKLAFERC